MCDSKKSRFSKKQEASVLLYSLQITTSLTHIPLVGPLLFQRGNMNRIVIRFSLAGEKFIPEIHLR